MRPPARNAENMNPEILPNPPLSWNEGPPCPQLNKSHQETQWCHSYPDFSFVPDLGGISGVGSNRSHELSVAMGHLPPSAQGKIREINHQVLVSFSPAFEKELHENIVKFWTRTLSFIQILTGPLSCQALRDTE